MKRLLLAMALILVMAIPGFAQDWVGPTDSEIQNDLPGADGDNGPIRIKPLMLYTDNESEVITPYFDVGQNIRSLSYWQVKGTGSFRIRIEARNSAGVLIAKNKVAPFDVDYPTFIHWSGDLSAFYGGLAAAGYYTIKLVYVDVATGKAWSHQTKIQVSAP
jgi:hypothetical protein